MAASSSQAEIRAHRQITAAIATSTALDAVLAEVARAAARLCHAPVATITLLTHSREELEVAGVYGTRAPIMGSRLAVGASLNGLVITTGRSVRSTNVLRDPRPVVRHIPQLSGARGVVVVPLRDHHGPFGTLAVAQPVPWHFTDRDESLLTQLANTASIAIQNAQLRAQVQGTARRAQPPHEALADLARAGAQQKPAETATDLSPPHHLSPREREILHLLALGKSCREVASTLNISSRTVQHYLERLKARFHQPRLPALVAYLVDDISPHRGVH